MSIIKVLNDNNEVVDSVKFVDNLTVKDAPDYVNFNGHVGLTRCTSEKYENQLVIMYFYPDEQELSYAEFIDEQDAYNLCAKRNRLDLAEQLELDLTSEREVL